METRVWFTLDRTQVGSEEAWLGVDVTDKVLVGIGESSVVGFARDLVGVSDNGVVKGVSVMAFEGRLQDVIRKNMIIKK